MAENSKIEWTDHTVNLWWGCTKVHAGCDNCYAETLSQRFGDNVWGNETGRKYIKSAAKNLDKYQKQSEKEGRQIKVFVGSMMDIFEKSMPLNNSFGVTKETGVLRDWFFSGISKGRWDGITFLLLTKRPSNINKMTPKEWKINPLKNVFFGCSPVDQKTYDRLVSQLLEVHGYKFLSVEPQLGLIDITTVQGFDSIDWIIQGGESGKNRRPFKFEWAHSMKDQCKIWSIPYFFKQIDKVMEIPKVMLIREFPAEASKSGYVSE